jgi:DNA-damage-inducible protein J
MLLDTVVRARVDKKTKEEAEAVLAEIGLTLSDAVRLMMIRIAREKAMPFNPLVPNEETIAAMREARAGKLVQVGSVQDLLADLNADDPDDEEVPARHQARKAW